MRIKQSSAIYVQQSMAYCFHPAFLQHGKLDKELNSGPRSFP